MKLFGRRKAEREALNARIGELEGELADARGQNSLLEGRLREARGEIADLSRRLEEAEAQDSRIAEVERLVGEFARVRDSYEERISRLKSKIALLRAQLKEALNPGSPDVIDMNPEATRRKAPPPEPDDDWLLDLPE